MKFLLLAIFSFVLCFAKEGTIKYSYSIWIGDEIEKKFSINLRSNDGIFFIDAMDEAAEKVPFLKYEATDSSQFGKFITAIGGHANVPDE